MANLRRSKAVPNLPHPQKIILHRRHRIVKAHRTADRNIRLMVGDGAQFFNPPERDKTRNIAVLFGHP